MGIFKTMLIRIKNYFVNPEYIESISVDYMPNNDDDKKYIIWIVTPKFDIKLYERSEEAAYELIDEKFGYTNKETK
jgi:hypothetical protein